MAPSGLYKITELDVCWGFNNVHMKEGDEWKAAFQTTWGLYKPLVMFFGLTNSLATVQTIMDAIFEDLISEGVVVVYLYDILIFTRTLEEHHRVVWRVLEILQQHNLSLKPEKCEFKKSSIESLGVVISHNSVNMDLAKVARVFEWLAPTNRKEVQSFLGFVNFYQRFIEGFSHISRPLFDLNKSHSAFKWTDEEKSAFDTLRSQITLTPILTLPDNSKPYHVEADSLDFATGAVLSQQNTTATSRHHHHCWSPPSPAPPVLAIHHHQRMPPPPPPALTVTFHITDPTLSLSLPETFRRRIVDHQHYSPSLPETFCRCIVDHQHYQLYAPFFRPDNSCLGPSPLAPYHKWNHH